MKKIFPQEIIKSHVYPFMDTVHETFGDGLKNHHLTVVMMINSFVKSKPSQTF